ncbi:hypothetical protein GALMADRAFT_216494 [Galerina marginata CBS 339.88]|uniref:DUF6533 domain-containing protein n=1 Tax=Galerina marginata (strain CBS 339.88) TaxID=685588 RepID=A0A067SBU5_GALM3|nr:hypothetical protein GALMADRAFT_216494 [Galerina marginata CBS 339.88]
MSSAAHTRFVKNSIQYSTVVLFRAAYSGSALLFYDYSLTWTREVTYVWRRKFTLSTGLYMACRCDNGYKVCSSLAIVVRAATLAVWGARTYAVYDKSRYIIMVFLPLIILISILDIIRIPHVVCIGSQTNPIFETFLASLVVLYEFLAAILTAARSWKALRAGGFWREKTNLLDLVIRDVSFFTVGTLILLHTAPNQAYRFGIEQDKSISQRLLNPFTLPVSGLVTARFLLHLREYEDMRTCGMTIGEEHYGSIRFQNGGYESSRISTIIAQFGEDPVLRARREADIISDVQSRSVDERPGTSEEGRRTASVQQCPSEEETRV